LLLTVYTKTCRNYKASNSRNIARYGVKSVRTQDISALLDWCRSVRTGCQDTSDPGHFGPKTFRHWCRSVRKTSGGLCLCNYV